MVLHLTARYLEPQGAGLVPPKIQLGRNENYHGRGIPAENWIVLHREECIRLLRPQVHCKGADYAPPHGKPIPEKALVEAYGGRVAFLPLVEGLSTTELIRRIQALPPGG